MDRRWNGRAVMAAAVLALGSCERPLGPPSPGQLALQVVSGDQQQGEAGQELAQPLVVKVVRADGGPVRGQILNFRVVSGGGTVFGGTELTDARGIAQERWTLGTSGEQKIEVRAVDTETGAPLVFATFTATVICHDCWTTKASLGTARWRGALGAINGRLYAVGGFTGEGYPLSIEEYDPSSDRWTAVGDPMPHGRLGMGYASLNGLLYVAGGFSSSFYPESTLDAFDPATGHWTLVSHLPTVRQYLGAGTINGMLYFVGGSRPDPRGVSMSSVLEAFDPATATWSQKASMQTPRRYVAVANLNGILYVIGGDAGGGYAGALSVVEAYDPTTDAWTTKSPLPQGRSAPVAEVVNGVLYVVGGQDINTQYQKTVYAYDSIHDTWIQKSDMPTARDGAASSVLNGLLYVVGGYFQRTVEAYKP